MKINMLREVGVSNPLESEVTPFKPNELVDDQTIDIFSAVIRMNLSLLGDERVAYAPTSLMRLAIRQVGV